jgi:CBS domain containing-hemolysin-like protein
VFYPIARPIAYMLDRVVGASEQHVEETVYTQQELATLVRDYATTLAKPCRTLVSNALILSTTHVTDIMLPLYSVLVIDIDDGMEKPRHAVVLVSKRGIVCGWVDSTTKTLNELHTISHDCTVPQVLQLMRQHPSRELMGVMDHSGQLMGVVRWQDALDALLLQTDGVVVEDTTSLDDHSSSTESRTEVDQQTPLLGDVKRDYQTLQPTHQQYDAAEWILPFIRRYTNQQEAAVTNVSANVQTELQNGRLSAGYWGPVNGVFARPQVAVRVG